jgi:hypothetical protein
MKFSVCRRYAAARSIELRAGRVVVRERGSLSGPCVAVMRSAIPAAQDRPASLDERGIATLRWVFQALIADAAAPAVDLAEAA